LLNRILIVDDDVELTELLREYMELENFSVTCLHDGASALNADFEHHDLLVLDVMLPNLNGFEVLKQLRQSTKIPVIMLTARDGDVDRIVGLELGADDYVAKPVNPRELVARIRAVLRRASPIEAEGSQEQQIGDIKLDPASRNAWVGGALLDLTTAEFDLLQLFLKNAGRVVSRDELSAAVFGRKNATITDRNVDTLVSKLRRKLGGDERAERRIKTIRNVGYLFAKSPGAAADADLKVQQDV